MRTLMKKIRIKYVWLWLVAAVMLAVMIPFGIHQFNLMWYPQKYRQSIERWAEEYDIDPKILYAVIKTESGFNPDAESNVGARGLMQITEETFAWIKLKAAPNEEISFEDLYDADTNIRFGAYFIDRCLERYNGDLGTAAAAYHSGWGTVDKLLEDPAYTADGSVLSEYPFPQMNRYVYKITRNYQKYLTLYGEQ